MLYNYVNTLAVQVMLIMIIFIILQTVLGRGEGG